MRNNYPNHRKPEGNITKNKRKRKTKEENKTIGIIICKNKNDSLVEITLPRNNKQIFASQYNLYLPSKEDLKQLVEEETVLYKTLKS